MPRGEIFSEYDVDYAANLLRRKGPSLERYYKGGIIVEGLDNLRSVQGQQTVYVSNHKSLIDTIFQGKVILETLPFEELPHFVAATQIDNPAYRVLGYNTHKLGFCWTNLQRLESDDGYYREWKSEVQNRLKAGESFFFYPEGTRTPDRDVALGRMKKGMFRQIVESDIDPLVMPIAIGYDSPSEEAYFSYQAWCKKKSFPLYLLTCALPLFTQPFSKKRNGALYINFEEPRKLSDIVGDKQPLRALMGFAREEIESSYQRIMEKRDG